MKRIEIIYDKKGAPSISEEVVVAGQEVEVSVSVLSIYTEIEIGVESNGAYTVQATNEQQATFSIILQPNEKILIGGTVSDNKYQLKLLPVSIRTLGSRLI